MKMLLMLLVLAVSVVACDDGKDGAAGIMGPSGFDDLMNPNAKLTDKQKVQKVKYSESLKGEAGGKAAVYS